MKTKVIALCLILLLAVGAASCSNNGNAEETQAWPTTGLLQALPVPASSSCIIKSESNDRICATILSMTEQDFSDYVAACREKGFNVDETFNANVFYFDAYNAAGYRVNLLLDSTEKKLGLILDAPIPMEQLTWPITEAGSQVPAPKSLFGKIDDSTEDSFRVFIGEMTRDDFKAYVKECANAGFDCNVESDEKAYSADNASGCHLELLYQGYNTVWISFHTVWEVPETSQGK